MPRLKLISAERRPPHAVLRIYHHPIFGLVQVPTFDGELYGGGGDVIWIAPLCTLLKFGIIPETPRDPRGKGKRPPAAPPGGGEAA
jgi:hypothetical protein